MAVRKRLSILLVVRKRLFSSLVILLFVAKRVLSFQWLKLPAVTNRLFRFIKVLLIVALLSVGKTVLKFSSSYVSCCQKTLPEFG